MTVRVNGHPWQVAHGTTLAEVLDRRGTPASGVAVAVDGAVVSRGSWADTVLTDGASIEVLTPVQGG